MLSYQHGFHAGCFADVVKHFSLSRILDYLIIKEKPLFYLETHAGRGLYDLASGQAQKTKEYLEGVQLIWDSRSSAPSLFSPYLQLIHKFNPSKDLRFYPGSPAMAIELLRTQDRLFLCELHAREFEQLSQLPREGKRVFTSHSEGISSMRAQLPPNERRGLIFIDPSFEMKDEYKTIPKALQNAYARFATGVFCLWYPIIDQRFHEQLLKNLKKIGAESALRIEFYLKKAPENKGMFGCGLWIINPPYLLADEMKLGLNYLTKVLNSGQSQFIIETVN